MMSCTKPLLRLQTWKLTNQTADAVGNQTENHLSRKGWHGISMLNFSSVEHRLAKQFAKDAGRRGGVYLTPARREWEGVTGPSGLVSFQSPEIGMWFEDAEDYLDFEGQMADVWPKRTIEFAVDRIPSKDEMLCLKNLNHMLVEVRRGLEWSWMISTEYSPRVVELRLRLAD
jgi:hypothetical protein